MGIIGQTQGVTSAISPPAKPESRIQKSDMPAVLPFMPNCCSSSTTGVQSRSLSRSETDTGVAATVVSLAAPPSGCSVVRGELFSASLAVVVVEANAFTVAGRSAALKAKSLGRGGVQLWSSQACARTSPAIAKLFLSVTRNLCTKRAFSWKMPICMPKMASNFTFASLPEAWNSPTGSAPVMLSKLIWVGVGPPSGILVS